MRFKSAREKLANVIKLNLLVRPWSQRHMTSTRPQPRGNKVAPESAAAEASTPVVKFVRQDSKVRRPSFAEASSPTFQLDSKRDSKVLADTPAEMRRRKSKDDFRTADGKYTLGRGGSIGRDAAPAAEVADGTHTAGGRRQSLDEARPI